MKTIEERRALAEKYKLEALNKIYSHLISKRFDAGFSAHEKVTEKLLRDQLNKYKSWYKEETQSKLDRGNPNFKRETELLAKIELLNELKKKLCQK